jgi:tRNA threonylcarbamoyl adenosine modification protein YjeE
MERFPLMASTQDQSPQGATTWWLDLPDEKATAALARHISELIGPGDLLTLSGDLGAGKTAFARALIRHLCEDDDLDVPSPTFTLMQVYVGRKFQIVHADLYRISSAEELVELGWDEAAQGSLVLVEWPERAEGVLDSDRLDIAFYVDAAQGDGWRRVKLTGYGNFAGRLARAKGIDRLLLRAGWADAKRNFMLGDASTRAYERLTRADGSTAVLMISPPRPDGPPVRYGKPYSAIARLAENITPFVAMGNAIIAQGLSAPKIYAADLETGLAILEDLGSEGVVDADGPIPERYMEAVAVLATLHGQQLPDTVPVEDQSYRIPPYDLDALQIEAELLTEWYAPHIDAKLSSGSVATFTNLWRSTLREIVDAPRTWVLRDYHSPNLIWLPQRAGLNRVGIIDFQDCVMGSPAYDVASLLQDARVTVPDELELKLLSHYARLRRANDPAFDMAQFARAYAIMAAQRATKILGIFARLNKRDRKPQYLAHIPRVQRYLAKSLLHPALADLKTWYDGQLPVLANAGS